MARRTKDIVIDGGRDDKKVFRITEMSADAAEWWAFRVLQALAANGIDIDDLTSGIKEGIAVSKAQDGAKVDLSEYQAPLAKVMRGGLNAISKIPPEQAKPILDEMMGCASLVLADKSTRDLFPGDIEDIQTRFKLRLAFAEVHFGFFMN